MYTLSPSLNKTDRDRFLEGKSLEDLLRSTVWSGNVGRALTMIFGVLPSEMERSGHSRSYCRFSHAQKIGPLLPRQIRRFLDLLLPRSNPLRVFMGKAALYKSPTTTS